MAKSPRYIYFKYWLTTTGNNRIFNLYGSRSLKRRIVVHVNPADIEYALPWQTFPKGSLILPNLRPPAAFDPFRVSGWYRRIFWFDYNTAELVNLIGGEWDREKNLIRFEETLVFEAFKQVFFDNKDWKDTEYYEYFRKYFYPNDEEKVTARLRYNQFLYNKIKNEGFRASDEVSGQDLEQPHPEAPYHLKYGEIRVAIGRGGRYILVDGNHRLALARLLGFERIPVRVALVHPKASDESARAIIQAVRAG